MKKAISNTLFILTLALALFVPAFGIFSMISVHQTITEMQSQGASGVDLYGVGMGHLFLCIALSFIGGVLALVSAKLASRESVRYISLYAAIFFALVTFSPVLMPLIF